MHRSSKCVVQKVYPDHHTLDHTLPCYCDHSCTYYRDCCQDYMVYCRGETPAQLAHTQDFNI